MIEKVKKAMLHQSKEPIHNGLLSTGVTLIDQAIGGGLTKGHIYRLAGRSSSGKTFVGRTILAEAANNPSFDGYELIYDDVEGGALMDTEKFFGRRLLDRLVPMGKAKDRTPLHSVTIMDFYSRLKAKLEKGKKVVCVEDSLDSLAPEPGTDSKMTDGKAKIHSQELRKLLAPLRDSGSILIAVAQVRVDMRSPFGGDITAGGRAPEFYSTLDIWLRKIKTLKAIHKGVKYPNGILVLATVKKNRLTGQDRQVIFPFYPSVGIDDLGANVDYLVKTKHWLRSQKKIMADGLAFTGSRSALIRHIQENDQEDSVRKIVAGVWKEIEDACSVERKKRYE